MNMLSLLHHVLGMAFEDKIMLGLINWMPLNPDTIPSLEHSKESHKKNKNLIGT